MPTTFLTVDVPVVSVEFDLYTTDLAAAVNAVPSAITVVVTGTYADRIRIQAFMPGLGSTFTGFLARFDGTVTNVAVIAASDLSGPVTAEVTAQAIGGGAGHYIWPVLVGPMGPDQFEWWIKATPDLYYIGPIDLYDDPWSPVNGLTPPAGYESGIYRPIELDRIKTAGSTSIYDAIDGSVIDTAAVDSYGVVLDTQISGSVLWLQVDFDDYATGWIVSGDMDVQWPVNAPGTPGVPATPPDNTGAPVITGLTATPLSSTSVRVEWETDILASSRVQYGATASYGSVTQEDTTPATSHSVTITGLTANTLYHVRAQSVTAEGQSTLSSDASATTLSTLTDGLVFFLDMVNEVESVTPSGPWCILRGANTPVIDDPDPAGRMGQVRDYRALSAATEAYYHPEGRPCPTPEAYCPPQLLTEYLTFELWFYHYGSSAHAQFLAHVSDMFVERGWALAPNVGWDWAKGINYAMNYRNSLGQNVRRPAFKFLLSTEGDPNAEPSLRTWHHIVITWDGIFQKAYVDGEIAYQPPPVGTPAIWEATDGGGPMNYDLTGVNGAIDSIVVGALGPAAGQVANGLLKCARIWNRALSAAEVAELYLLATDAPCSSLVPAGCTGVVAAINADTMAISGEGTGIEATQWRVVQVSNGQVMASGTGNAALFSFSGMYSVEYQLQFADANDNWSEAGCTFIFEALGSASCTGVTPALDAATMTISGSGSGDNATAWRIVRLVDDSVMDSGSGSSAAFSFTGAYGVGYQLQFQGADGIWSSTGCAFQFNEQLEPADETQPINPWVILKWSDDGGFTWSNEHWRQLGRIGQYKRRAVWRRLGRARDRVIWVEITDPVKVVFTDAYLNAHPGTS